MKREYEAFADSLMDKSKRIREADGLVPVWVKEDVAVDLAYASKVINLLEAKLEVSENIRTGLCAKVTRLCSEIGDLNADRLGVFDWWREKA